MIVGITINEYDIINFSIKDANGIHRYYEKEAVSNGEELIAIVDGKQIKLREAFHFEMVRKHSKLSKKADEQSKPIGKFKDNAALQKAYESLEKEFTRRSQRLRELQKERENMQAEIIRLNDIKFTQEHCDLYEENEWLKAELEKENAELQKKVENQKAVIIGQAKRIEKEKAANKRMYDEFVRLDDFCATKGCICCVCENKKTCKECNKCEILKTEKCNNFKIDVSKYTRAIERADKLQKQVDELQSKENNKDCFGHTIPRFEDVKIEKTRNMFDYQVVDRTTQQAKKDILKEILEFLKEQYLIIRIEKNKNFKKGYMQGLTDYRDAFKKIIKDRYGTEVE